jgi:hypothetical protein
MSITYAAFCHSCGKQSFCRTAGGKSGTGSIVCPGNYLVLRTDNIRYTADNVAKLITRQARLGPFGRGSMLAIMLEKALTLSGACLYAML